MRYSLFDLEITTLGDANSFNCSHRMGETLIVEGENISYKHGTEQFSHYALATLLPYIAAKQRSLQPVDWMFYETDIACPDPKCGAIFRITRTRKVDYQYSPRRN